LARGTKVLTGFSILTSPNFAKDYHAGDLVRKVVQDLRDALVELKKC